MIQIQSIRTDSPWYPFLENLLVISFPPEEYRELEEWRLFTDHTPHFHNHAILDENKPVGLLTYWEFDEFYYIEHFAIHPGYRNAGYGGKVLQYLFTLLHLPIVLEVELPTGELEQRRIGFYERQGFVLWQTPYQQPPYRPEGNYLPMLLMAYGNWPEKSAFNIARTCIYRDVYLVK